MAAYPFSVLIQEPFIRAALSLILGGVFISIAVLSSLWQGYSWLIIAQLLAISLPLLYVVVRFFAKGRTYESMTIADLDGKVAVITGANSGIGFVLAKCLGERGAHVIMACRSLSKAEFALQQLREDVSPGSFEVRQLDLADQSSVRAFALTFSESDRIDLLVNNGGVMQCPFSKTADGIEMQFGTNHIGHFLLTNLLLRNLEQSEGRIVNVSSMAHYRAVNGMNLADMSRVETYDRDEAYGISKLANVYFTKELARRLEKKKSQVKVVCLHPGGVKTELFRHSIGESQGWSLKNMFLNMILRTPEQGTQTSLYCCLSDEIQSGEYYADCNVGVLSERAFDSKAAQQLWKESESLCGL